MDEEENDFYRMQLNAKKFSVYIPVADEFLNPPRPTPVPRRTRLRARFALWRFAMRERIGFWIAGYTPDDY